MRGRLISPYSIEFQFVEADFADLSPQTIFQLYQKRGNMENFIKEIKTGFFVNKTDSSAFLANKARLPLSFLAYNLIRLMKQFTFPDKEKHTLIDTIRFKLFHIAGKMTEHARQIKSHLSSTHVYNALFWEVLLNSQR